MINAWSAGNTVGAYSYNLFGNQVSYTPDGVVFTSYTYRPDGLRHSIGNKVHVWDGENIVADIDGSNVSIYIRGINLIYADDGDKTYYHFNAHGDVVVLINTNGSKTKSYSYNAFGVEYNESTLDDNPFRYCGEYYDKETKTIYLRARYYNAAQGRFTQEDPIRDGYNWYSYCGGNPVNCVDSTGFSFTKMQDVTDDDGLLEGEPLGLSGGGARAHMGLCDSTIYNSYAIRGRTAIYDANYCSHHSNTLSSGTTNFLENAPWISISTGRTTAQTLEEQIAMKIVKTSPESGKVIINSLNDPRLPIGTQKIEQIIRPSYGIPITIHYDYAPAHNIYFDFKFK